MGNPCSKILMIISHLLVAAGGALADCMYKNDRPENCNWLGLWTKIMQNGLKLCWPGWGSSEIPKSVYLHAQLEEKYCTSQKQ